MKWERTILITATVALLVVSSALAYSSIEADLGPSGWYGSCWGPVGDLSNTEMCLCGYAPATNYQPGGLCCKFHGVCDNPNTPLDSGISSLFASY